MKKVLTVAILLLLPAILFAQAVKGRVTDAATGKPLENVNVYLEGTYQVTITNSEGNFTLNPGKDTNSALTISYVGYQSQKITDYAGKTLSIALKRKVIMLNEVTVVDRPDEED
ncbi:carboxypeptidase-like regulatory domain-containing protein [Mucilaginibacter calamicampi]|uniref:Carboxypeptidase-like regulatory domain-containing protein n=1 Tax=Mucilaginibacter calamicampi TaxID=1302352 RepID=A0ABW2YYR2_9SPHI